MPMCFVKICAEKAVVGVNEIARRCVPFHRTACYGTICGKVCGRYMFLATFKKKTVGDLSDTVDFCRQRRILQFRTVKHN